MKSNAGSELKEGENILNLESWRYQSCGFHVDCGGGLFKGFLFKEVLFNNIPSQLSQIYDTSQNME